MGANVLRLPRTHHDLSGRICRGSLHARLPQTVPDTGFVPGVKGSPVQIRPSRPLLSRSEGVSDLGPRPLFDLREPAGHLTPRHPHQSPPTSRSLRRCLTGPLAEPPRRGWLRRRRFPGSGSCHGCPLVSCRGTLSTRATVSSLLSPPLKASTACWMASAIRAADMSPSRATTSRSLSSP
jgi:hypothetical protein